MSETAPRRFLTRLLDALSDRLSRRRRHDEVALQRAIRSHPAGKARRP